MAQRADFNHKAAKAAVKPIDSTSRGFISLLELQYMRHTEITNIRRKHKAPAIMAGALFDAKMGSGLQVGNDVREHVTNRSAEQGHNNDDHDGYQNKNQRIFYEPLPFFILEVHSIYLLSLQFSVGNPRRLTKYKEQVSSTQ